ncbi:MAG TPA: hypothetical protein VLA96_12525 [Terriglobales bacterium]|nr:hypothetical protein [Terriglobales bacterium]
MLPPPLQVVTSAWLAFGAILVAGIALSRGGRWGNMLGRVAGLIGILGSAMLRAHGTDAIGQLVPEPLQVAPLPMLWLPFGAAAVLWALSAFSTFFRGKENAPAEAGASR